MEKGFYQLINDIKDTRSFTTEGARPRSMVTYDKGPPRDFGQSNKIDNREIGLAHDE